MPDWRMIYDSTSSSDTDEEDDWYTQDAEYFVGPRHLDEIDQPQSYRALAEPTMKPWRLRERMRTMSAALVICLNLGVDPPDIVKPDPCARMECWVDPETMPAPKALKEITLALQSQYMRWQPRARYKALPDPTADDVRRLLISLRRAAGNERVLFHYNGHGVPKPTANGEVWVYDKNFTQYIPLSLYDVQQWLNPHEPAIYVFDCPAAGLIVDTFNHFLLQHKEKLHRQQQQKAAAATENGPVRKGSKYHSSAPSKEAKPQPAYIEECRHIILAACSADEILPMNPQFPADLFTACLTTPIKTALRWFVQRSPLYSNLALDLIDQLPGMNKPNNRKSPFGELNWIFTAITDSIAWNVLPSDLFHKLFRQDLLVASLFRNYLLVQRVFHSLGLTPVTRPALPPTHRHPMWDAWDLAADHCISQLIPNRLHGTPFEPSTFFEHQLTGFEVWLDFGNRGVQQPMQLPVVLQVLLSQSHRLRALQLLARFLDKGNWATNMALSVGIFPYVLKLLQSQARDLRRVLVFVWAKILSLDPSCQTDLTKSNYSSYFLQHIVETRRLGYPDADIQQALGGGGGGGGGVGVGATVSGVASSSSRATAWEHPSTGGPQRHMQQESLAGRPGGGLAPLDTSGPDHYYQQQQHHSVAAIPVSPRRFRAAPPLSSPPLASPSRRNGPNPGNRSFFPTVTPGETDAAQPVSLLPQPENHHHHLPPREAERGASSDHSTTVHSAAGKGFDPEEFDPSLGSSAAGDAGAGAYADNDDEDDGDTDSKLPTLKRELTDSPLPATMQGVRRIHLRKHLQRLQQGQGKTATEADGGGSGESESEFDVDKIGMSLFRDSSGGDGPEGILSSELLAKASQDCAAGCEELDGWVSVRPLTQKPVFDRQPAGGGPGSRDAYGGGGGGMEQIDAPTRPGSGLDLRSTGGSSASGRSAREGSSDLNTPQHHHSGLRLSHASSQRGQVILGGDLLPLAPLGSVPEGDAEWRRRRRRYMQMFGGGSAGADPQSSRAMGGSGGVSGGGSGLGGGGAGGRGISVGSAGGAGYHQWQRQQFRKQQRRMFRETTVYPRNHHGSRSQHAVGEQQQQQSRFHQQMQSRGVGRGVERSFSSSAGSTAGGEDLLHAPQHGGSSQTLASQASLPSRGVSVEAVGLTTRSRRLSTGGSSGEIVGPMAFEEQLADPNTQLLLSIFVLSAVARGNLQGQMHILQSPHTDAFQALLPFLSSPDPLLRQWTTLTIGCLWQGFSVGKSMGAQADAPLRLCELLADPNPEIRTAALWALGTFMGGQPDRPELPSGPKQKKEAGDPQSINNNNNNNNSSSSSSSSSNQFLKLRDLERLELELGYAMAVCGDDASPMVRRELGIALAELIYYQQELFVAVIPMETAKRGASPITTLLGNQSSTSGAVADMLIKAWAIWQVIHRLCRDPVPAVSQPCNAIRNYIRGKFTMRAHLGMLIHTPGGGGGGGGGGAAAGGGGNPQIAGSPDSSFHAASPGSPESRSLAPGTPTSSRRSGTRQSSSGATAGTAAAAAVSGRPTQHLPGGLPLRHFDRHKLERMRLQAQQAQQARLPPTGDSAGPPTSHPSPTTTGGGILNPHQASARRVEQQRLMQQYQQQRLKVQSSGGSSASTGRSPAATTGGSGSASVHRTPSVGRGLQSLDGSGGGAASGEPADLSLETLTLASLSGERAFDPMWTVPQSNCYDRSAEFFGRPLLQCTGEVSSDPVASLHNHLQRQWRQDDHDRRTQKAMGLSAPAPATIAAAANQQHRRLMQLQQQHQQQQQQQQQFPTPLSSGASGTEHPAPRSGALGFSASLGTIEQKQLRRQLLKFQQQQQQSTTSSAVSVTSSPKKGVGSSSGGAAAGGGGGGGGGTSFFSSLFGRGKKASSSSSTAAVPGLSSGASSSSTYSGGTDDTAGSTGTLQVEYSPALGPMVDGAPLYDLNLDALSDPSLQVSGSMGGSGGFGGGVGGGGEEETSWIQIALFEARWEQTGRVLFHPYEPYLFTSDHRSNIGVWDYKGHKELINTFSNARGARINHLGIINEDSASLLLTGSDDGVVRIWRDPHLDGEQQLVTAWVAAPPQSSTSYAPVSTSTAYVNPSMIYRAVEQCWSHFYSQTGRGGGGGGGGSGMAMGEASKRIVARHSASATNLPALESGVGDRQSVVGSVGSTASGRDHHSNSSTSAAAAGGGGGGGGPEESLSRSPRASDRRQPPGVARHPRSREQQPSSSHAVGSRGRRGSTGMNRSETSPDSLMELLGGPWSQQQQQVYRKSRGAAGGSGPGGQAGGAGGGGGSSGGGGGGGPGSSRSRHSRPLVVHWQGGRGRLVAAAGGAQERILVWDAVSELCVRSMPFNAIQSIAPKTAVTSLTSHPGGNLIFAGGRDGTVRMLDTRVEEPVVQCLLPHGMSRVMQISFQPGPAQLVSVSQNGVVGVMDARMTNQSVSTLSRPSHRESPVTASAIHDFAPIMATGSHRPAIEVFDINTNRELAHIRYHVGFLGQRLGNVTSLAFHPHKRLLAAGAQDSLISIYAGQKEI